MKTRALIFCALTLASCSGMRQTGNNFTVHAESFHIVGFTFPEDDKDKAHSMVPAGSNIQTVHSSPSDWTSFWGGITRILGFSGTEISGTSSRK